MIKLIEFINKFLKFFIPWIFSRNKLIYVGGYPNIPNIGDVALFKAYEKAFEEKKLINYQAGKIIKKILGKKKSPAILGGGTLINRLSLEAALEGSSIFYPFFVLGTGVAQTYFWNGRKDWQDQFSLWAKVINKAEYIGVRGPLSQKLLIEKGFENVAISGDPVVIFTDQVFDSNKKFHKRIGLNVGRSKGNIWGDEANLEPLYKKLALDLKNKGWEISWFVVCNDDLDITIKIAKETGTEKNIVNEYYDCEKFFKEVKQMDFFIGMKLHSVVLAMCKAIPSIMLEYQPKCLDFMMSVNMSEYNVRIDQVDFEDIYKVLAQVEGDYNNKRKLVWSNMNNSKECFLKSVNIVNNIISKK
jgi:polysaccharide pyruvyl transferase WcaK-like protein